jgi:hypothetical protein
MRIYCKWTKIYKESQAMFRRPQPSADHMLNFALHHSPRKECEKFIQQITAVKAMHNSEFPDAASDAIARCFYEIDKSCQQFSNDSFAGYQISYYQKKYLELCGLLWSMHDALTSYGCLQRQEKVLADTLLEILREKKIQRNQDLPGCIRTGKSCIDYYNNLHPKTSQEYMNALYALQMTLRNSLVSDELQAHCNYLMKEIEVARNECGENTAYCASILKETSQLVKSSVCGVPDFAKYATLADNAPGKPSTWKKVVGAMLAVAGVVAFAAFLAISIALSVVSYGAAIPLLALGITEAVAAYGILGALGGTTLAVGFLSSAERKGLSRTMADCHNAAQRNHACAQSFFDKTKSKIKVTAANAQIVEKLHTVASLGK